MPHYFNENDAYPAAWLRALYPYDRVDQRSIRDVRPEDISFFRRCHFFAGIGGWRYALDLAGWPPGRPAWTGSCPCQPFSGAGRRQGTTDERHLWPEMLRLIRECRPPTVFGEQVASADGRLWLAGVRTDLEALGYAVGAADLCAAGVGAPHIRQRLYWVAYALPAGRATRGAESGGGSVAGRSGVGGLDDAYRPRLEGRGSDQAGICPIQRPSWARCWDDARLIACTDGKTRRIGSGVFPLAHGIPSRVGRLRAYGNAIVPALAAEFVRAFLEAEAARE